MHAIPVFLQSNLWSILLFIQMQIHSRAVGSLPEQPAHKLMEAPIREVFVCIPSATFTAAISIAQLKEEIATNAKNGQEKSLTSNN